MGKLTQLQARFADNYIKNGFNATQAAKAAGYSEDSAGNIGNQLTNHPIIAERIERATARIDEAFERKLKITLQDKLALLKRIVDDILPEGEEPKRKYLKEAMQAIELMTKMQGHFMPNRSINVTLDATKERLKEVKKVYKEY